MPDQNQNQTPKEPTVNNSIESRIAEKINSAKNILIALSSDPSVDEMCCALGLTMHLDRMEKRATAIYSGHTPNALEFLKPDDTFETTTDGLQDFVIAISKDKADHLRYKLDGEYVKVYITPYRSKISEEDLDFSYGDFNIDLVISLGVDNGIDLDSALREHGRIMHDASVVNITTGNPGKFGEIEWSDKSASSVSEIIARFLYGLEGVPIDKDEATAFLTGIVAATDRFSRANTTSACLELASRLMDSGANHQLISKNITEDLDNKFYSASTDKSTSNSAEDKDSDAEPSSEDNKESDDSPMMDIPPLDEPSDEKPESSSASSEEASENEPDSAIVQELKAAEEGLSHAATETTPEIKAEPLHIDSNPAPAAPLPTLPKPEPIPTPEPISAPEPTAPEPSMPPAATPLTPARELNITPPTDFDASSLAEGTNKYGKMLEDALSEPIESIQNPAVSTAPEVASAPEINGVPEINYSAVNDGQVLPPPPMPPVDFNAPLPSAPSQTPSAMPESVLPPAPTPTSSPIEGPVPPMPNPLAPESNPEPTPAPEPIVPEPAPTSPSPATPPENNPGAFRIPGM